MNPLNLEGCVNTSIRCIAFLLTSLLLMGGCASTQQAGISDAKDAILPATQQAFFDNLKTLCGQTFTGASVYPEDPNHDFAGKKLVAEVSTCTDDEVQIPFTVGDDTSRTWIISVTDAGLLFKHFHRYSDGSHHEVSRYGGYAADYREQTGTAYTQYFPADAETATMLPKAKTNAWMMSYDPKEKTLTYYLERHEQPRYKAVLKQQ